MILLEILRRQCGASRAEAAEPKRDVWRKLHHYQHSVVVCHYHPLQDPQYCPLLDALEGGHPAIAEELIRRGANVNQCRVVLDDKVSGYYSNTGLQCRPLPSCFILCTPLGDCYCAVWWWRITWESELGWPISWWDVPEQAGQEAVPTPDSVSSWLPSHRCQLLGPWRQGEHSRGASTVHSTVNAGIWGFAACRPATAAGAANT